VKTDGAKVTSRQLGPSKDQHLIPEFHCRHGIGDFVPGLPLKAAHLQRARFAVKPVGWHPLPLMANFSRDAYTSAIADQRGDDILRVC